MSLDGAYERLLNEQGASALAFVWYGYQLGIDGIHSYSTAILKAKVATASKTTNTKLSRCSV